MDFGDVLRALGNCPRWASPVRVLKAAALRSSPRRVRDERHDRDRRGARQRVVAAGICEACTTEQRALKFRLMRAAESLDAVVLLAVRGIERVVLRA